MNSFAYHIQERSTAAIKAINGMKNLKQLSTTTAMTLFKNMITPIVTYGIEIVWQKLTVKDLERIEKVKASFMKRVMGVGMNAPSRMAYVLMGELFFIEELRLSGMLPTTKPYQDLLRSRMACADGRAVLRRGNTAIRQATNHKAIPRPIEEQNGVC